MGRKLFYLGILFFLSGCYHTSSSLVGPVYTLTSTGNISQTFLTYSFNKKIESNTGKSSIEFVADHFQISKNKSNSNSKEPKYTQIDQKILYDLVKSNLEKTKKILSN